MPLDQLIFEEVVSEAEERHRAAQDELRADVQQWFDDLTPRQKDALGAWMDGPAQYDTCARGRQTLRGTRATQIWPFTSVV